MGFLGFGNGIRRRAIKKEESVFDEIDRGSILINGKPIENQKNPERKPLSARRLAHQKRIEAQDAYLRAVSSGNISEEKTSSKNLSYAASREKKVEKIREERLKPVNSTLEFVFSSKREYGQKPKRFKTKAVRGLYRSPFAKR